MYGRFAPSPTSQLHLGNLRTAILAYLMAQYHTLGFVLRIEDLDQQRVAAAPGIAKQQLADLAALGLSWSECIWQSQRLTRYQEALTKLQPYLYECFCSRKEILAAAQAPNGDGFRPYPRTCLRLSPAEKTKLRQQRKPALRLNAETAKITIQDYWAGEITAIVDDFVVQRGDGVFAYNFAVVVDDIAQNVTQITRGDDLLSSAPRQAYLTQLLGGTIPQYAHVPLVYNTAGKRLAKRDRDVTLAELSVAKTLSLIAQSLGLATADETVTLALMQERFEPKKLKLEPWYFSVN